MNGKLITTICENCGKTFQCSSNNRTRKSCSEECRYALTGHKNSTEPVIIYCERCGKAFEATPYQAEKGKRFCSFDCKNPPAYSTCLNCGIRFRHAPSAHPKYCSRACVDSSEQRSIEISNRVKTAWQTEETRLNMMKGIESRSELDEWKSAAHFQKGDKHPRYKGNRTARISNYEHKKFVKAVLRRDKYTCQQCGSKQFIQVHHIKSWADYPELRYEASNGVALCEECHIRLHGGTRKPRTRICVYCQKQFRPAKRLTKYCSKECFHLSLRNGGEPDTE